MQRIFHIYLYTVSYVLPIFYDSDFIYFSLMLQHFNFLFYFKSYYAYVDAFFFALILLIYVAMNIIRY